MSFAEFGAGKPGTRPASAPTSANSSTGVGYSSTNSGSTGSKSGLEVISETLLQYQVC